MDGGSLLPALEGKPVQRPHPLYWQYDEAISKPWVIALRDGPWKLMSNATLDQFELFDLSADTGEKQNLADRYPDRVKALAATMKKLHAEVAADCAKSGNPDPRQGSSRR